MVLESGVLKENGDILRILYVCAPELRQPLCFSVFYSCNEGVFPLF